MNFYQRNQLEDLTKVKLEYTQEVQNCSTCKHSAFDDYHLYCMFSNICTFKTVDHASCNKYAKKEPQQHG